jgi:hypothetical protein
MRWQYGKRHTPSTFLLPCLDPRTIGAATQSNENDHVKKRTKTHGKNERVDVMNSAPDPRSSALRRRSTRVLLALPLIVRAVDALGRPFQDLALTETVNCHGCRYRAEHLALKNTSVNQWPLRGIRAGASLPWRKHSALSFVRPLGVEGRRW